MQASLVINALGGIDVVVQKRCERFDSAIESRLINRVPRRCYKCQRYGYPVSADVPPREVGAVSPVNSARLTVDLQ